MQSLTIRLLGPVEADRAGEPLPIGGRMPRGALAVLALSVGAPVTVDSLIDSLWGDPAPPSARSSLAAHMSRLRSAGLGSAIRHRAGGYVLELPPQQVDLHRALAAHANARSVLLFDPAAARGVLDEASSLWRGQPLAGLDGMPFVAAERQRCQDRLEAIRRDRVDALLAGGSGVDAVDDLLAMTRAHPLSERLWCQLMRALHAAGRRVEALQAYKVLAHNLRTELGLDPSRATQDLHRALLRGDLDPGRPPVVPAVTVTPPLPLWTRTPFIGRGAALQQLTDLTASARVVTVVGMSGVGKTRLALAHVERMADADLDGPWICDLSDLADGAEVVGRVARALGLERLDMQAVVDALGHRRVLLVLDGVEQVAPDVADLVTALQRECSGLRVLATSLTDLGIAGESVLRLDPMGVEPGGDAGLLLRTAARHWQPDGSPPDLDVDDAEALVRVLEGIPLAIELAAAHLDHLPPADLVAVVAERTASLHAGVHRMPARHRTLQGALRWSVGALDDGCREVLSAAAVFAGGFTTGALAGMLRDRDADPAWVPQAIDELGRRALLHIRSDDRGTRHHMLDAIRHQLTADRPARRTAELQDAHARWAHRLSRRADAGLRTADQHRWWDRLSDEAANLAAAMAHGLRGGDPELALDTAGHLGWWWYRRGEAAAGRAVLDGALAAAPHAAAGVRMRGHVAVALLSYLLGDVAVVETAGARVLADEGAPGADPLAAAQAQLILAHLAAMRGDTGQATVRLDGLLDRELPAGLRAEVLMSKGFLAAVSGSPDDGLTLLRRAVDMAEAAGDWWVEGSSRWIAAKLLVDRGDGAGAITVLCPVLRRFAGTGDRTGPLAAMHTLAAAITLDGDPGRGALVLAAVDNLGARLGYHPVRMDPRDAPRHRAIVTAAADDSQWDRAQLMGAGMSFEALLAMVCNPA